MARKKQTEKQKSGGISAADPGLFGGRTLRGETRRWLNAALGLAVDHWHLLVEGPQHNHLRLHERRFLPRRFSPVLQFSSYSALKEYHSKIEVGALLLGSILCLLLSDSGKF